LVAEDLGPVFGDPTWQVVLYDCGDIYVLYDIGKKVLECFTEYSPILLNEIGKIQPHHHPEKKSKEEDVAVCK